MFNSRMTSVPVIGTTPGQKLLSASTTRWGIMLSINSAGSQGAVLAQDPTGADWNNGIGFPIIFYGGMYEWNVRDHGSMVQDAWFCDAESSGSIGVVEIMACDCESLALLKDALGHRMDDPEWHKRYGRK